MLCSLYQCKKRGSQLKKVPFRAGCSGPEYFDIGYFTVTLWIMLSSASPAGFLRFKAAGFLPQTLDRTTGIACTD